MHLCILWSSWPWPQYNGFVLLWKWQTHWPCSAWCSTFSHWHNDATTELKRVGDQKKLKMWFNMCSTHKPHWICRRWKVELWHTVHIHSNTIQSSERERKRGKASTKINDIALQCANDCTLHTHTNVFGPRECILDAVVLCRHFHYFIQ